VVVLSVKNTDDRVIPRAKMPEGIDLCKKNIIESLNDARLIIAEGRLSHAYISVQFALEKLGKILIFREKLEKDSSDPLVIKHKEAFKSHSGKTEKVWKFLDPKFKKIFDEGIWEDGLWERGIWQENTCAEYQTRLDCAFVDFYALRWQIGRDIKKELLVNLINHIEEKLPQA
jgi:AbiV family abortive infection protein